MTGQYIHIRRKKYAAGLLWQPMVAGFTPRAYAYKLARGIDKKLNRYIAYSGMIGLGARSAGQRSGMPSIAAEIIESLPGYASMLCAFHVDGKFVLVAVRNGVILHDLLFTNESDARAKYAELTEIPDWNALIAPSEWGMPRAVDRNLADILSGTNHGVLRPISRVGAGALSFLLLLIFALVFLYLFREPINQMFTPTPQTLNINPELAEKYKQQLEEKNKELDKEYNMRQEPVIEPLVMPFDSLPDVTERADLCFKAIGFLMQPVTGWIQVSAECNETYVNATFRRSFGTLEDFYAVAADIMPGVFVQEISDNEISVRAKLPARAKAPSRDSRDADTIVRDLTSRFQAIKMNVNMDVVSDIVANDTQSQEIDIVQISAESKMIPYEFMQIFYDFDGVYMTKASWNMIKKIWNYEVIIYAN
ncbi:MAG: type 4b pilus protein PilO2 [Alphaproteobacteria bacterium]|nr:type 4b pilus protein PilO2 [Alphaproteobacteria bacterium]MBR4806780.1 type 4b pilus protein PilO2 [Alphaproteobacteria bacterium]